MRVAVVGAGVSGLAAAHELAKSGAGDNVRVTVYEKADYLGGHARTVAVGDSAGGTVSLDLGFMVFNRVRARIIQWQ
jgi:cyclopropane-fatty-acyl-phospholipid synthase